MKDLVFLMLVLGFITLGMMAAQKQYRFEESEKNEQYKQRYYRPASPTPSPSITP